MIVSWMTTNKCNLKCVHCYQDAEEATDRELSTEEAMKMILGGECGAFNPVLLQCLTEAQDKIKESIVIKEENGISCRRNVMKKLRKYEDTKEHLMESITQDIQRECSEIEKDTAFYQ